MRSLTDVFTPGAPTLPEGLRTLVVSPERELEPGMTVRATFTFRNQGGAVATGVRVRFNLPEGLVYLIGTGRIDGAVLDDEHGNSPLLARAGADIGEAGPGQERRIEIAYSVAGAIENGTPVELQAAVAAFELAPVGSNVVRLVARSRPALENSLTSLAIESRQHEPRPGGEATITLRIHNAGESSAHDVAAVVPVPEHASYIPNSVRINGRDLERDLLAPFDRVHAPVILQSLSASATATLQYRIRIDDPLPDETPIVARASVASQETPGFEVSNAAIIVRAHPEFEDERTVFLVEPEGAAAPGTRVTVRLHAYNAGTTAALNSTAALTFPDGLIPVRGSVRVDGRPVRERKGGPASYQLGNIAAREDVELSAEATVGSPIADGTVLPLRAVLRWQTGSRDFERTIEVRSQPFFGARANRVERIGAAAVHPSDECEASVFVTNEGSAAATDVVLHLQRDSALDDLAVFDGNTRLETVNDSVELGAIAPYASRTLLVRARVRTPYADRSEIVLAANLHMQELGEVPLGSAHWRVESHPAFSAQTSSLTLVQDDVFRPNQLVDVYVRLRNEGTDVAQNVCLRLYISPEARLEMVDGAIRERSTLLFGEIAPGAAVEARLGVRLLRSLAKAHPVTIESVVSADATLPVQLGSLAIVTTAEPNFAIGTLHSQPEEVADAGEEIEYILHVRNSGDGPARLLCITAAPEPSLIYVPNSTCVNDLPVRDVGARSPLMDDRGLVLRDVDPGVEATIRWREVVSSATSSGEAVVRSVRVAYDGDRTDEIAAREMHIRCAPNFGNSFSGLPFGLDGILGPSFGVGQRAIAGSEFLELPPATPVMRSEASPALLSLAPSGGNGHAGEIASDGIELVTAFDRDRLDRTLRFLAEARFKGLVTHLFAVRAFFPDAVGGGGDGPLRELRQALRETLDRVYIKLRVPNYVLAPRDVETAAVRADLETLLGVLRSGEPASQVAGAIVLHGYADPQEMAALRERLDRAPIATALPWAILARMIPANGDALANYSRLLCTALDDLAGLDEMAFIDTLQRRAYTVLDAALDVVRAGLAHVHA